MFFFINSLGRKRSCFNKDKRGIVINKVNFGILFRILCILKKEEKKS